MGPKLPATLRRAHIDRRREDGQPIKLAPAQVDDRQPDHAQKRRCVALLRRILTMPACRNKLGDFEQSLEHVRQDRQSLGSLV